VDLANALFLVQALRRTQRLMDVDHYLDEHDLAPSIEGLLRRATARAGQDGVPLKA